MLLTTDFSNVHRPCGGCTDSHTLHSSSRPCLLANVPQRREGQTFKLLELNSSKQEDWLSWCFDSGDYSSYNDIVSSLFAQVFCKVLLLRSLGRVDCTWTSPRNSTGIWMCSMRSAVSQTSTTISVSGSVAQKSRKVILSLPSSVIMSDTKAGPTSFQRFSPSPVCG